MGMPIVCCKAEQLLPMGMPIGCCKKRTVAINERMFVVSRTVAIKQECRLFVEKQVIAAVNYRLFVVKKNSCYQWECRLFVVMLNDFHQWEYRLFVVKQNSCYPMECRCLFRTVAINENVCCKAEQLLPMGMPIVCCKAEQLLPMECRLVVVKKNSCYQ
ncbi:unnamed protein product [Mytilus edulis]|uniref:Uncharacterized protein n=1 Tax=Mytilus edulis TaxID=6550 RepID=A0A8S3PNU4_MYTED|nr:unnamed protein product [Mytilus edulis]